MDVYAHTGDAFHLRRRHYSPTGRSLAAASADLSLPTSRAWRSRIISDVHLEGATAGTASSHLKPTPHILPSPTLGWSPGGVLLLRRVMTRTHHHRLNPHHRSLPHTGRGGVRGAGRSRRARGAAGRARRRHNVATRGGGAALQSGAAERRACPAAALAPALSRAAVGTGCIAARHHQGLRRRRTVHGAHQCGAKAGAE